MKRLIWFLLISSVIHVCVFTPMSCSNRTKSISEQNSRKITLLPNGKQEFVDVIKMEDLDGTGAANQVPRCKDNETYDGIGVTYGIGTGQIATAPPYYPAYKAGVRVGDVVINSEFITENGYTSFTVSRLGVSDHIHFKVKLDKICYETERKNRP